MMLTLLRRTLDLLACVALILLPWALYFWSMKP